MDTAKAITLFLAVISAIHSISVNATPNHYWYDDQRKISIHYDGYAYYSRANSKKILTGRIIVRLAANANISLIDDLVDAYQLTLIKKIAIGNNFFLLKTIETPQSLSIANEIYESGKVAAAYPDWQYVGK